MYQDILEGSRYAPKQIPYLRSAMIEESSNLYHTPISPILKKLQILFFSFPYLFSLFFKRAVNKNEVLCKPNKILNFFKNWFKNNDVMSKSKLTAKNF